MPRLAPLNAQPVVRSKSVRSKPVNSRTGPKPSGRSKDLNRSARDLGTSTPKSRAVPLQSRSRTTRLQPLPNRMPVPQWLRLLKKTERLSLVLAGVLASGAIVTYGWAMYSQQQWGTEYRRLDQLRRNERQLTTNGEFVKNNIARTSDPKQYGLVPRSKDHIVVIPPSTPRPPLPMRAPGPDPNAKPITPIGY